MTTDEETTNNTSPGEETRAPVTVQGKGSANLGGVVATGVRAYVRNYYSSYHLFAAEHFASLALEIENSSRDEQKLFRTQHRAYVMSGIVAAAAFVEASINEVFQDAADGHNWQGRLEESTKEALALLWDFTGDGERFNVLAKYDRALSVARRPAMDRSKSPHQDVSLVIEIRNWLMHFKPRSVAHDDPHKLATKLKAAKFELHALYSSLNMPLFPDQMLSADCVRWAHESARQFVDEFSASMGLTLHHAQVSFGDPRSKFA